MNLWKRATQRKLSSIYFVISLLFITAGFWFAIPRFKGLGITWTLISVVMGIYYGMDVFTKKGVFRAAEPSDRTDQPHTKAQTLTLLMEQITAWIQKLRNRISSLKKHTRGNEPETNSQVDDHKDPTARTHEQQFQKAQDQAAPSREKATEGFIIPDSQTAIPMPPAGGFQDEGSQGSFEIRLRSLERLRQDGLISDEEYLEKRKQILEDKW